MEEEQKLDPSKTNQHEIACSGCGAALTYKPGTTSLTCDYCGTVTPIDESEEEIKENDFLETLKNLNDSSERQEIHVVKCNGCGAESTLAPNVVSDDCPFCGTPLVVKDEHTVSILKPKSLLPFAIESEKGMKLFKQWLDKLWWAPNDIKKYATHRQKLVGIYMPFWTYDTETSTDYTGQKGINYTETYTVTVNGKTETRTRTKTRWYYASGNVYVYFNDLLIRASKSLSVKLLEKLEPWDLNNLVPYDDKYLSGFKAEKYQIDLEEGYQIAKQKMIPTIESHIRSDIGGDKQRIHSMDTTYSNIKFKHILLPVWISSYIYKEKTFHFMINARTGEVQGERPYSWVKITLGILGGLLIIGTIIFFYQYEQGNIRFDEPESYEQYEN